MQKKILNPTLLCPPNSHYSLGVRAGNTIYCAGMNGSDKNGRMVGDDIEAQTDQAVRNLQAVLEEGGASLQDVVKVVTYMKDIDRDRLPYMEKRKQFFGDNDPAGTICEVSRFIDPKCLVVLDAIAVIE